MMREFGTPEVRLGGTRSLANDTVGGQIAVPLRTVTLGGEWHLWVYCCAWSVAFEGSELALSESDPGTVEFAAKVLTGRSLSSVKVCPLDASTVFSFDRDCTLSIRPSADDVSRDPVEQWKLYQPSGEVLIVRSDGRYANHPGDSNLAASWLPIA